MKNPAGAGCVIGGLPIKKPAPLGRWPNSSLVGGVGPAIQSSAFLALVVEILDRFAEIFKGTEREHLFVREG
jgi:hypothetical protein